MPNNAFEIALWAVAGLGVLYAFLPPILDLLGLSWLSYIAHDDPDGAQPADDDPEYADVFQELCALGFEPAGSITESMHFMCAEWSKSFHIRCLRTSDSVCIASLYRLADGEGLRICLNSCTSAGGIVRTVTPGAGVSTMDERDARIEVERQPLAQMLDRHWEHVGLFCRQRGVEAVPVTLQAKADIDQRHELEVMRKNVGNQGFLMLPASMLLGPAVMFLFLWQGWGLKLSLSEAIAVALCIGSIVFVVVRHAIMPYLFQQECLSNNPPRTARPFTSSRTLPNRPAER